MPGFFLLKTEPSEYSFADLLRDGQTQWDGVTNPAAVKNLREMPAGSKLVIYETGNEKRSVGLASVISVDASDPRKPIVVVKAGRPVAKPVTLEEIKTKKAFASSPLVKMGRLSVVPLTEEQYRILAAE